MRPITFALVDAVLRQKEERARRICGLSAAAEKRWEHARTAVGWWRSTRGGA